VGPGGRRGDDGFWFRRRSRLQAPTESFSPCSGQIPLLIGLVASVAIFPRTATSHAVNLAFRQVDEMADFGMADSPALSVLEGRPREAG
jgi:hypothetical protein